MSTEMVETQRVSAQTTTQVAVVCESTACLPPDLVERYHIGIVPIPFVIGTRSYLDGVDITPSQFYAMLPSLASLPQTSPPTPGAYINTWQQTAGDGHAVVSVTVDSKVSTLQRSTLLAQELAAETLPGVDVRVVDSLSAGMGQGFVALAAARAAAAGKDLDAVVAAAERMSRQVQLLVTLDTLDYLAKTSRIPQVAALFGGILAIKPIVQISGGDIRPLTRVRTRQRSVQALVNMMRERVERMSAPGARVHLAVQHARAAEEAAALEDQLRGEFDCAEIFTTEFTPVMGGYCGPGLLGIAFYLEADADAQ